MPEQLLSDKFIECLEKFFLLLTFSYGKISLC